MIILLSILFLAGLGLAAYAFSAFGLSKGKGHLKEKKINLEAGEMGSLKAELEKLKADYAAVSQEAETLKKREADLQAELTRRDEWVDKAEEAHKKTKEEYGGFEKKLTDKEKELQEQFSKNVNLTRQIQEFTQKYQSLEGEHKITSEENQKMKHQIEQLLNENKEQLNTISEFKKQQEDSDWVPKQEFIKLNEEYSQLKKELEQLKNKEKPA